MKVHLIPYSLHEHEQDIEWSELLRSIAALDKGMLYPCPFSPEHLIWTFPEWDEVSLRFPCALSAAVALLEYRKARACR